MKKSKLASLFLLFIFCFNLFLPPTVYGRIRIKNLFRHIKRGVQFTVTLPDKATRWMGPVLGPIAADLLTQNIGRNPRFGRFFRRAQKANNVINNIDEQKKLLNEYRKLYQDEANDLRKKADEIDQIRKDFAAQVTKGDLSFDDFKDKVANLEKIKDSYLDAADKLDSHASRMNEAQIVKMVTQTALNQTISQVRDAVIFETTQEIKNLINPDIINSFISGSKENLLDLLISSDLTKIKNQGNFGDIDIDRLRENVKNAIKQTLKDNKDNFKNNWQEQIKNIVESQAQQLKDEKDKLETPETPQPTPIKEKEDSNEKDENNSELDDLLDSETGNNNGKCKPGYIYKPNMGLECVQDDCYNGKIPNAHMSYEGYCVCGSSGSINDNPNDPNKECSFDNSNKSCPSCVYACVGLKEECPKKP